MHKRKAEDLKPGYVYSDEFEFYLFLGYEGENISRRSEC